MTIGLYPKISKNHLESASKSASINTGAFIIRISHWELPARAGSDGVIGNWANLFAYKREKAYNFCSQPSPFLGLQLTGQKINKKNGD